MQLHFFRFGHLLRLSAACGVLGTLSWAAESIGGKVPARAARSVHLQWSAAESEAFYVEGTVAQSTPGTYVSAIGWSGGYFGVQELRDGKKVAIFSANVGTGDPCAATLPCSSPWIVISSPTQGYRAAADINADELVDGVDLASILGSWGDAPRVPFPPSDCPLNLINP